MRFKNRIPVIINKVIRPTGKMCMCLIKQSHLLFQFISNPNVIAIQKSNLIPCSFLNATIAAKRNPLVFFVFKYLYSLFTASVVISYLE